MAKTFRVGLIGFGNIGTGLNKYFQQNRELMERRTGIELELKAICDRNFNKPKDTNPPETTRLTGDWKEITEADDIDAVVELIGVGKDGDPSKAREVAVSALSNKKHFITANKGLIAPYGSELHELARKNGVLCLYEASVGAGIPIIASLQHSLIANDFKSIHGMVNGTCNYILTELDRDPRLTVEDTIETAKELGYAEPDPTFDVEGHDSAYKIVILSSLAYNQRFLFEDVRMEGLRELTGVEFDVARRNNLSLKLVASAVKQPSGKVSLEVGPAFIPKDHVLAGVNGVYNAVLVEGDPIGETMFYGAGAGKPSTASGLLADIVLAARIHVDKQQNPYPLEISGERKWISAPQETMGSHYYRINFSDSENREKAEELGLPGRLIEKGEYTLSYVTEEISLAELDNFLGKLEQSHVNVDQITHVRLLFGANITIE